jgi:class 3 adenylate cyclase
VLRWHDDALRAEIENHRGEVVHTTGDGFFATFEDVEEAAACAVAMQRHLAAHRQGTASPRGSGSDSTPRRRP